MSIVNEKNVGITGGGGGGGGGGGDTKPLGTQLVSGDIGQVTQSVIHGLSTAGGGSYVDVKVNPSGALAVSIGESTVLPTQLYGEAIEALEAMRFAIQALTRTIGQMQPDTAARMRVAIDAISAGLTLATITTVGTVSTVTTVTGVTTVSTLTNQTQIGGFAANEQIPALMRLGVETLRRNISVS